MENNDYNWYILFPNHHEGLHLNKELKARGIKCTISPTPREASTSCGISLIILEADLEVARQLIEERGINIENFIRLPKKKWDYRSC